MGHRGVVRCARVIFGSALALSLIADGLCLAQPADPAQKPGADLRQACLAARAAAPSCCGLPDRQGFETRTHPYPYLDDQDAVILYPGEMITIGFNKTDRQDGRHGQRASHAASADCRYGQP